MPARNDITGDSIASRGSNEAYRNNWGKIFGEKPKVSEVPMENLNLNETEIPLPVLDLLTETYGGYEFWNFNEDLDSIDPKDRERLVTRKTKVNSEPANEDSVVESYKIRGIIEDGKIKLFSVTKMSAIVVYTGEN